MTSLALHLRSRLIRGQPTISTIRTAISNSSTTGIITKSIMASSIMENIGSYISFNVAPILGWKKDPCDKHQDTKVQWSSSTYPNNSYNNSGHFIHCYNGVDSIWNSNHILMEYTTMDSETEGDDAMIMEEDFSTWLISTLKRRKKKMNKHKLQKRRKRERLSGNKK